MPTRRRPALTNTGPAAHGPALATVYSNETGRSYRLDRLIGKGGFGEIYLATPTPAGPLPAQVCVKISFSITGWLREAYFAQLLERQTRSLRVFDRFVEPEATRTKYCLVMEYAEHGDLGAWLEKKGGQPERFVRQEISAILETLDVLHRGQALHRDLTPFNVFVCKDEVLKLGDFGIATHQISRRGVTADAFNPLGAPTEIAWGKVRKWQQKDDIHQVGQLIAIAGAFTPRPRPGWRSSATSKAGTTRIGGTRPWAIARRSATSRSWHRRLDSQVATRPP